MPKFQCTVREKVSTFIEFEVEAETKEEAAQIARDRWVINGEGELREDVDDRWVEIDGESVELEYNP